ncbi:MAG: hypothetical protein AAB414_02805 [Patescibacteria group bacterium]
MEIKLLILTALLLFFGAKTSFASSIKINEFYSEGTSSSNPDWVEIYTDAVDTSLYQIVDAANNKQDLATSICNGNFCYIDWSNRLNKDGDTIKLELKSSPGQAVDQVIYGSSGDISSPGVEQSAGRNSDATGGWVIFLSPTKGSSNNNSTASSPSPSPSSSPSPSTSSSSSSTSSSSSSSSSTFTISNVPSKIDSTEEFKVSVNLSLSNSPNTTLYLKGAFKKKDGSNYFGLTKVGSSWKKNSQTYSDQSKITTNASGGWSGNLEIQPDIFDSGYEGGGDYIFKVGRYTEVGSLSWSNELTVSIIAQEITLEDNEEGEILGTEEKQKSKIISSKHEEYSLEKYIKIATPSQKAVQASPQAEVKGEKQRNYLSWFGTFMVISGIGVLSFVYLRNKNLSETLSNIFRKRN